MNSESVSGPRFNAFAGTFCQRDHVEAAVKQVTFRQNIGALVALSLDEFGGVARAAYTPSSGSASVGLATFQFWSRRSPSS